MVAQIVNVLEGGRKTITHFRPFMLVEYQEENARQCSNSCEKMIYILESLGYDYVPISNENIFCFPR